MSPIRNPPPIRRPEDHRYHVRMYTGPSLYDSAHRHIVTSTNSLSEAMASYHTIRHSTDDVEVFDTVTVNTYREPQGWKPADVKKEPPPCVKT